MNNYANDIDEGLKDEYLNVDFGILNHYNKFMSINFNRVVLLVRGISGASKSTFAEYLKDIFYFKTDSECVICCADDYFYQNPEHAYQFNPAKLGEAHKECQDKYLNSLEGGVNLVIICNTSTTEKEVSFYEKGAKENGYTLFSIVMEKRFEGGDNGHNVPEHVLQRQEQNLRNSLKLR